MRDKRNLKDVCGEARNELKLICNCKETTYEAILIERNCMLSINKKADKQI